jgi:DDE family transposase
MGVRATEKNLTSTAGLVHFGVFTRNLGLERLLQSFNRLKTGASVAYPMAAQMRMLLDAFAAGEERIFGLEALAADPLFVRLSGGVVPSLDTCYRDLCRFDSNSLAELCELAVGQGLAAVRGISLKEAHLDFDTTVETLFGTQQGALPGPNPRYHGRPSYHPFLARIAETDTVVGAVLRPGDTGIGAEDIPWIEEQIDRVRKVIQDDTKLYVRIDAGGDCTAILNAIHDKEAFFVVKAKKTRDLLGAVAAVNEWTTTDWDADGKPREQVAEIPFVRECWGERRYRIVAVRTRDRKSGEEIFLWDDIDMSVQIFITNEHIEAPEDVARRYNRRAGIEPLIGELKHSWGIGKVPSQVFEANHAMLLLKVLAYNLMRRYVRAFFPELQSWRAAWLRRVLIVIPGRLVHSGRSWTLLIPERSMLTRMLN